MAKQEIEWDGSRTTLGRYHAEVGKYTDGKSFYFLISEETGYLEIRSVALSPGFAREISAKRSAEKWLRRHADDEAGSD